ncbi:MAG: NADH dehydrogenase [Legionellales bacterium RIFCSPHIGHO2_12_FULL_37_14]|nr:MAG: NADH dehydrogenase [Legionellales bacterium RIFCSPHIGHO2_12_FULL_37_14]
MSNAIKNKKLTDLLTPKEIGEVDSWVSKYPPLQKQSAVLSALTIAQNHHSYLTQEIMDAVAEYLEMPAIAVYEAASFYSMFEMKPVGKHIINVCTNISCQLQGSKDVVKSLEKKLGIKLGETTKDGHFTLRGVECLAQCVDAPAMQIKDKDYLKVTPDSVLKILESYK